MLKCYEHAIMLGNMLKCYEHAHNVGKHAQMWQARYNVRKHAQMLRACPQWRTCVGGPLFLEDAPEECVQVS